MDAGGGAYFGKVEKADGTKLALTSDPKFMYYGICSYFHRSVSGALFIGNTFEDGGAFQLYGMSIDCIVAENTGTRMDSV